MTLQLVNQGNIFGFKSIDSELPLFPKRYWYEFWKCPNVYNLQENNVPTGHTLLPCILWLQRKKKSLDLIQWGQRTICVRFIPWTGSLSARRGIEDEIVSRGCSQHLTQGCSFLLTSCPRSPALVPPAPTKNKEWMKEQTQSKFYIIFISILHIGVE